ncbi:hypothetical protein ACRQQF_08735 [Citrobacter arsenatis]|uniref:hypothetical protein n=1 Tax=Citrobacter arsenatis TaxID=2546350 RepID=UPI003D7FFCCD
MKKIPALCLLICPFFVAAETEWECQLPSDFSIANPFHYLGTITSDLFNGPTANFSIDNNLNANVSTANNISNENANKVIQVFLTKIYIDTIVRVSNSAGVGGGDFEQFHMVGEPNDSLIVNLEQYPPANRSHNLRIESYSHARKLGTVQINGARLMPLSFQSFVTLREKPVVSEYKNKVRFMTPVYVDNEYASASVHINMESVTNTQFLRRGMLDMGGDARDKTFNDVTSIFSGVTCKSTPVPLSLTLTPNIVTFGSVTLGGMSPTTRELRWNTTGSGKANIWSVRFESTNVANNKLTLGGATVSITGKNDQEIPVNTDVAIEGTSGTFNFHLDPTNGTISNHETSVNVVLTAN